MTPNAIVDEVKMLAGPGSGQVNRAWALSWRAVRFLEQAVETARRARHAELDPRGPTPIGDPVKFIAARCLRASVKAPVTGEAQVAAALESAVDCARLVAARLYAEYKDAAEKASEEVLRDPRRLARLRRNRSVVITRVDRFLVNTGIDQ
jgi:hypothetical protein